MAISGKQLSCQAAAAQTPPAAHLAAAALTPIARASIFRPATDRNGYRTIYGLASGDRRTALVTICADLHDILIDRTPFPRRRSHARRSRSGRGRADHHLSFQSNL